MKEIVFGEWFNLPMLSRDLFSKLMSAKLMYEKSKGFRVSEKTDLYTVLSILEITLGEEVGLVSKCYICMESVSTRDGGYERYDLRRYSHNTICSRCSKNEDAYTIYTMRFAESMG